MKVEVDEVCFSRAVAEPACAGQLLDLIASVKKLGHLLITLPPFSRDGDSGVNMWVQARSPAERLYFTGLLEGWSEAATSAHLRSISVSMGSPKSSPGELVWLSLSDASTALGNPLRVLLENRSADWQFLVALCPPALRPELEAAKNDGRLAVDSLSGLPALVKALTQMTPGVADIASEPGPAKRLWVMCDRDADPRDVQKWSPDGAMASEQCERLRDGSPFFGYWQLQRRAIENYIPDIGLDLFLSQCGPGQHLAEQRFVSHFRALDPGSPIRWHLHLKEGLNKDVNTAPLNALGQHSGVTRPTSQEKNSNRESDHAWPDEVLDPLFRTLGAHQRRALREGLGSKLASVAYTAALKHPGWDAAFQAEFRQGPKGQPTQDQIIHSILELL